jgi:hypothetical protein
LTVSVIPSFKKVTQQHQSRKYVVEICTIK